MFIVCILVSKEYPERIYIGLTENISQRVSEHNAEKSSYSREYGPWKLITHTAFSNKKKAIEFERYLKSGSGFAFAKKHLL